MSHTPRILFVSPYIPNPKATVEADGIDFFYYRNTIGQGVFQLRQMQSWHPLHFLAQNLPVDSVVLENPTMQMFQREVERGGYDIVAFSFTVLAATRILRMVSWIKEHFPSIEAILGGYGIAALDDFSPIATQLRSAADGICRGEGLSFMRSYLSQRYGMNGAGPLRQDLLPTRVSLFRTRIPLARQLCFVHSLGCYYKCVFCSTSSQFGHRKVYIVSPRQLYTLIKEAALKHPRIDNAIIYDEDFLSDRRRILQFISYLEGDEELKDHPFLLTVFSSVRSISQYSLSELIRLRIGVLFIGVESFRREILERETARKRTGKDIAELFHQLHSVGIHTLGSMIIGWDNQTLENIQDEIDSFVALNPTLYQVMPLQAPPGSPLWAAMKDEGRLLEGGLYAGVGVTSPTIRYKNFTHEEVLDCIDATHRLLVRNGGPSVFKMFENLAHGIRTLRDLDGPEYRARAAVYRKMISRLFLLAFMSRLMFHGQGFRTRWSAVMKEWFREQPVRATLLGLCSLLLLPILVFYCLGGIVLHHLSPYGEQPETIRREYHAQKRNG